MVGWYVALSLLGVKLAVKRLMLWRRLEEGKLPPRRSLEFPKAILLLRSGISMAVGVVLKLVQFVKEAAALPHVRWLRL